MLRLVTRVLVGLVECLFARLTAHNGLPSLTALHLRFLPRRVSSLFAICDNLKVEATGLEYKETDVSDATCTQYSSADCERY